jgi:predicted dehydrogenase
LLRVAIVGCGRIADAHASQIGRIDGCEIVAACDKERLMARQLSERFPVRQHFDDLTALLEEARPDVVHVTTPPASHFGIARACLEAGCHVYVEKPFTLCEDEARSLVTLAEARGLKLTAGHDDQFSHVARRMRTLVQRGYLGGAPVHMESSVGYDLADPTYAGTMLRDGQHWVRDLPGGLFQNVISHGLARIAEFLTTDSPQVMAFGFVSPTLKKLNERSMVDELRVLIAEESTTAYFTFSSAMRPTLRQFRIYGPRNGLVLDQDHETLMRLRGARFRSYAQKFVPPVLIAEQQLGDVMRNAGTFMAGDFHMKSGLKHLIESFYRSIAQGTPVPIPYREILLNARLMDAIVDQIGSGQA